MSDLKVINIEMHWADIKTSGGADDLLEIGGVTPGGKAIKIVARLFDRGSIGYLGETLHQALKRREDELRKVRAQIEGKTS